MMKMGNCTAAITPLIIHTNFSITFKVPFSMFIKRSTMRKILISILIFINCLTLGCAKCLSCFVFGCVYLTAINVIAS